jgi:hypothetical protein
MWPVKVDVCTKNDAAMEHHVRCCYDPLTRAPQPSFAGAMFMTPF